jgi:hypothetical protein
MSKIYEPLDMHTECRRIIKLRIAELGLLRAEVERLRKALLCPECAGKGQVAVFGITTVNWMDCPNCEAAKIRKEAQK